MNDFASRREFTRVPVHIWGTFMDGDHELVTAEITTLSLRGCYASTFQALRGGESHRLILFTDDDAQALHITMQARVVRSDEKGMGIEFIKMPMESYDHLRRLVLLNASDPGKVESEFRAHVGLKRAA